MDKQQQQIALSSLIEELRRGLAPILAVPKIWLDEVEASRYLSISTHALRKWRSRGSGGPSYYRIGNRIVYGRGDLDNWVQAHRVMGEKG